MDIQIPKNILKYKENLALNLPTRQCVFGSLAILTVIGSYFIFGKGLPSFLYYTICALLALPFAAIGFFSYQDMQAEDFLLALYQLILTPKGLVFESSNFYEFLLKPTAELSKEKKGKKKKEE